MKETTNTNDFSKGSVIGTILRLAGPMTFAQLINLLYNIIDRMYIGHLPENSTLALTGLGLTFPIVMLVSAFTRLFGMGGAPLFSIARGKQDEERAGLILGNAFCMLLLSGIVLTIAGLLIKKPLLYAFGASDQTFPYADSYLSIYLVGSIFVMISLGMNSFINAQGFAKKGMMTVMIGAVLNIILDPIFIFVFDMGVQGAALATILSQGVSAVWVLHFLVSKQAIIPLTKEHMKLQLPLVKEITSLGTAGFIMAFTNSAVSVVCNASLQAFGGDIYVGIMTVINSNREVITMPISGITSASEPVMGFNYGAKKYDRVKTAIKFTATAGIIYTTLVWILLLVFPRSFIHFFNSNAQLIELGVPAMTIYFFGFFMMSFQFGGQTTFTALGYSKHAIFFSLFRKAIIVIPLTLLLPHIGNLGVHGVFLAEPISNFIGGAACFITMLRTVWPKLSESQESL